MDLQMNKPLNWKDPEEMGFGSMELKTGQIMIHMVSFSEKARRKYLKTIKGHLE